MGYVMYVIGELEVSRELEKEEKEFLYEQEDFYIQNDVIKYSGEFEGLCPSDRFEEMLNKVFAYAEDHEFTLKGMFELDMTMGCCGKERWIIEDNIVTEVIRGIYEDFMEDISDEDLINELRRRMIWQRNL